MRSTLNPALSKFDFALSEFANARWADEPFVDEPLEPTDLDLVARPSKQASFVRLLIAFCVGVAATLAWQSYGGTARKVIASWSPQLRWPAPQAAHEAATHASLSPQLGRPAPEAAHEAATHASLSPQLGRPAPEAAHQAATRANLSPQLGRPAPQAAPAAAPRATEAGGFGFVVQLSALRSEPEAQAAFRTMQAKYSVLSGRQPLIRRKDQGERGIFYAAQVGPFGERSDADQLCETLKSTGGTCFVQKNYSCHS
jgi:cell division septation protein DedD